MGITNVSWNSLKEVLPENIEGKLIVNLGDQIFYFSEDFKYNGVKMHFLKDYFLYKKANCEDIDWHGNNDVIKLDFRESIPEDLVGKADIVTNFGFTEHVDNQYMAWKNIHNLVKTGGIVISELPGQPDFPGHFEFPYYTTDFFQKLIDKCGYKLVINRYQQHEIPLRGQVVFCVFEKVDDREFISKEEFETIKLGKNDSTGSI